MSACKAVPLGSLVDEARAMEGDASIINKVALLLFQKYQLLDVPVAVSKWFPLDMADYLRARGAKLEVCELFLPERIKKSRAEVEHIRESLRWTCAAFERIENILHESKIKEDSLVFRGEILTSEVLKREVERILFDCDMEDAEGMIISSGYQAAMPHHEGAGPIRPRTSIVCDIFPRNRTSGYFADMTRTYVKGAPPERLSKMYDAVAKAQDAAFKVIKAGVRASDAHAAAEKVIQEAGFDVGPFGQTQGRDQGFIHGLGHGLGLDVHEAPSVGPHSRTILGAGTVITVEPGLYYPEWGGVRLEDVVVVTEQGCENLTNYSRKLEIN